MTSSFFILVVALPLGLLGLMVAGNGYPGGGFVVFAAILGLWFANRRWGRG